MEEKTCTYCKKPLEKVECSKYEQSDEYDFSIHEGITFLLFLLSLVLPSFKQKVQKHKYKITCTNKDCIDYLKGCYVNKHNLKIWSSEFPNSKDSK